MRALLIAISAIVLGACGGSPPPGPPLPGSVTLDTVHADGTGFLPLEGDQPLVAGAQGGFHVWLKYRVSGMAPGKVHVLRTVRRVSDHRLLLTTEGNQEVGALAPDGTWELPTALPSFFCPSPLMVKIEDEPSLFDVVITTIDGAPLGEGTAEATPRCPTDDQRVFCQRICDG